MKKSDLFAILKQTKSVNPDKQKQFLIYAENQFRKNKEKQNSERVLKK